MNQPHMPPGCYSVKTAAEKLGIRPDSLLKKMAWRGWLYAGKFRNDPLKNIPLQHAIDSGYLRKVKRNAPPPHDWEIAITKAGLTELGAKVRTSNEIPTPAPLSLENAQKMQSLIKPAAASEEREKALAELEAMGFLTRKAS